MIVHGRGLSNINLGIFVCSFDVCRASKPLPYINNYGLFKVPEFLLHAIWSLSKEDNGGYGNGTEQ